MKTTNPKRQERARRQQVVDEAQELDSKKGEDADKVRYQCGTRSLYSIIPSNVFICWVIRWDGVDFKTSPRTLPLFMFLLTAKWLLLTAIVAFSTFSVSGWQSTALHTANDKSPPHKDEKRKVYVKAASCMLPHCKSREPVARCSSWNCQPSSSVQISKLAMLSSSNIVTCICSIKVTVR